MSSALYCMIMILISLVSAKHGWTKTLGMPIVSIEDKLFRNDRKEIGGGVAIYVKDALPEPKFKHKDDKLELLPLEVKQPNATPFFFVCWYRPQLQALKMQH